MVTNTALWQAINAYELDDADAALPFSRRLARDNGWSRSHALSAIAEYKRFIYLICHTDMILLDITLAGTVLTPSEDVDAVWHLHLIYTHDYWDRFCGQTLGRQVHHGPTKGGATDGANYRDCYRQTLALYRQVFGPPPRDIWPDEAMRFRPRHIRPIDMSTHIVLPPRQVFLCLTAGLPLLLAGCRMALPVSQVSGPIVYGAFGLAWLFFLTLNLPKILRRGLAGFLILAGFLTVMSLIFVSGVVCDVLDGIAGGHLDSAVGQGLNALLAMLLAIRLHSLPHSKGGSGDGGGCGATYIGGRTDSGGHGHSGGHHSAGDTGGHSGGDSGGDSGVDSGGSSGCGGGCGGGGD
jgi:hypothetical protein